MQFSLALNEPFEPSILSKIRARLLVVFGPQRDAERHDPMSQLIKAFISTQTRNEIAEPAFDRLRRRYGAWEPLSHAAPGEIEEIIRPVTHADQKAVFLPRALRMIVARSGNLDLDFLADWDEEMAVQWLEGLPGVGPKIAATVVNFSMLRKRVLAVDRHLLRVGKRLGLLPLKASYETGYDLFMRLAPNSWDADDLYEFHWLMKYHGQRTCTFAAPACSECRLRDLCAQRIS